MSCYGLWWMWTPPPSPGCPGPPPAHGDLRPSASCGPFQKPKMVRKTSLQTLSALRRGDLSVALQVTLYSSHFASLQDPSKLLQSWRWPLQMTKSTEYPLRDYKLSV